MKFSRRVSCCVGLAVVAVGLSAEAVPRRVRDRFRSTFSLGGTIGVGSPRGVAGAFIEVRPWRAFGVSAGTGFGGAFGPSVDGTVVVSPFGTRGWALDLTASLSHQFGYASGPSTPDGRSLPTTSNWVSVGVASEWRPMRNLMVRVGAGRAFLLNTSGYGALRAAELDRMGNAVVEIPGQTPLDAARSALAGETFGVWFVHIDLAPVWRW